MIELLVLFGVLALIGLLVFAGVYLLNQRRSGTVRAVLFPRRGGIRRPRLGRRGEEAKEAKE